MIGRVIEGLDLENRDHSPSDACHREVKHARRTIARVLRA